MCFQELFEIVNVMKEIYSQHIQENIFDKREKHSH